MKRFGASLLLLFLVLFPVLTSQAQSRGEVLRAEYGSGNRWADVTLRVRSLFRGNNLRFRADNLTLGTDPTPGFVKTLRLVVRERNRIQQVEFQENQIVNLRGYNYGGDFRGLRILGAQYGVAGRMMDVTDRLNARIRGDRLNLQVVNQNMGGDPAQGQVKALWVWYLFNGQPVQMVVNENGVLNLPTPADNNRRDLLITRAQYGANNRFFDVTDLLNAQVRDGQLRLQVMNQTMGGDPARGRAKVLTVWYTLNGRPGQAVVNENGVLNLPDQATNNGDPRDNRNNGALQITRALYGAGNRVMDVTTLLNQQIQGGQLRLQVMNQTMGGDPAEGVVKTLTVWYISNGRPAQIVVNENGILNLPGGAGYTGDNRPYGNPVADIQTIRCESNNNERKYCSVDTRGGVLLLRALSNATCNQGSTWGFDQDAVWVDYGCRADFQVRGAADPRGY